ncbi:MAG: hypothetical protein DWQ37_06625 [Planctomycetota bacterium]|nr:MAG: hypothetical protein DWQ37_06625 [Planctomycetota bacterium]
MAEKIKSLSTQVNDLATRLKYLETQVSNGRHSHDDSMSADGFGHFCALPEVPQRTFGPDVSAHRARLIQWIDKKWVNGTRLRYYFFESGSFAGGNDQTDLVRRAFEIWEDVGIGISFEEVTNIGEAEIRIGFLRGDGSWSYVGRDVIDVPGQFERTMNFGWDLTRDPRGVDTPVHEIGHSLGFPHEHQNPFAGIVWDEEAVYDYFGGPPNNWTRESTFHNVLRKLPAGSVEGSQWDPNSVMHYGFPAGLILSPEEYRGGLRPELGLSAHDIAEVRRFYPPLDDSRNPRLVPMRLETLTLEPAQQMNFTIESPVTDDYTIQTFGRSDTVMVLFEDVDGQLRYVGGSDDSGTSTNATLHVRLRQGRRYVLRLRLYLNYASGETAVMMW